MDADPIQLRQRPDATCEDSDDPRAPSDRGQPKRAVREARTSGDRVTTSAHRATDDPPQRRASTLQRLTMAAATAFATINIWTGCPLVALWVAGQVSGEHRITMTAFGVFVLAFAVLEGLTLIALAWLNDVYDQLTGRQRVERRSPWLRAMSDEAEHHVSQRVGISLLERIVMINVYLVVIAFVVWYVFFAGPGPLHCIGGQQC